MARPLRIEYPGAWYHVLNRGRRKEKIFFNDRNRKYFLKLLGQCTTLFKCEIHAYSLMPNHYHLLISTPAGNLSRIMRHINGVYTQYINKQNEYEGSLFKGRFKSILIEKENYLLELIRYIHRNPFKAGLEKRLGEHIWTSHRAYLQKTERPPWLEVRGVLERFSAHEKEAVKELDAFVKKEPPRDLEERLDSMNWPSVLGGDSMKAVVKKILLGKELDFSDIPDYKEYREKKVSADAVLDYIGERLKIEKKKLKSKRDLSTILVKRAFVFVCREMLQMHAREIGAALGGVSRMAISKLYKSAWCDNEEKKGCYQYINMS